MTEQLDNTLSHKLYGEPEAWIVYMNRVDTRVAKAVELNQHDVHNVAASILRTMKHFAVDERSDSTPEENAEYLLQRTRGLYDFTFASHVATELRKLIAQELQSMQEADRTFQQHRVNAAALKYTAVAEAPAVEVLEQDDAATEVTERDDDAAQDTQEFDRAESSDEELLNEIFDQEKRED